LGEFFVGFNQNKKGSFEPPYFAEKYLKKILTSGWLTDIEVLCRTVVFFVCYFLEPVDDSFLGVG
jgi:hypothetical protein